MDERQRALDYASKRAKALRNMEQHIQGILFPIAKQIVEKSSKYRRAGKLSNERAFLSDAKAIAAENSHILEDYTRAYALASCKFLGIDNKNIAKFLDGDIHGKTILERFDTYMDNFAEDIVRMVKAGSLMGYTDSKILSAVRTGYKDPYSVSVITKAQRKDINIATPSYGQGFFHNAYDNIVRNAKQTISLSWGMAEQQYGKEKGAIGFKVFRGSSYPCAICDDECAYTHTLRDPYPPFHVNCVCWTQFVYKKESD